MQKLVDRYGRIIDTLRVSITDRCNFKCLYCNPEKIKFVKKNNLLNYEEIIEIIKIFLNLGIKKIKITGGEPFLRKNFIFLLNEISKLTEFEDMSITTNGFLLYDFIPEIKKTNFKRINISLNTIEKEKYKFITGIDGLEKVIKGIEKGVKEDLKLKINVVVIRGINDNEIFELIKFGEFYNITVRFIELMPAFYQKCFLWKNYFISGENIFEKIKEIGKVELIEREKNFSPNTLYFKIEGYKGSYGIITPLSKPFCHLCNRIRLTAEGSLLLCIASNIKLNLNNMIRNESNYHSIEKKIKYFIFEQKPLKHNLMTQKLPYPMCNIGG
jgi:cyclic pyranopterin phosphate synthase